MLPHVLCGTTWERGLAEQYGRAVYLSNEQSIPSFWLKCILARNSERVVATSFSADDVLFVTECRIVQELADRGPCIIVGRCADFVLFCYSDMESAVTRCVEDYSIPREQAEAEIRRVNRNRIHHYEYYTGGKWGEPHHYHLLLDTGRLGLDMACRLVKAAYREKE